MAVHLLALDLAPAVDPSLQRDPADFCSSGGRFNCIGVSKTTKSVQSRVFMFAYGMSKRSLWPHCSHDSPIHLRCLESFRNEHSHTYIKDTLCNRSRLYKVFLKEDNLFCKLVILHTFNSVYNCSNQLFLWTACLVFSSLIMFQNFNFQSLLLHVERERDFFSVWAS